MSPTQPERRGVRFDATINLGHVLTFCGFMATGFMGWSVMDKRVVVLEERSLYQARRDEQQEQSAKDLKGEIRDALKDLHNSVEKLSDKLDKRK